jgi:hypothetical protein
VVGGVFVHHTKELDVIFPVAAEKNRRGIFIPPLRADGAQSATGDHRHTPHGLRRLPRAARRQRKHKKPSDIVAITTRSSNFTAPTDASDEYHYETKERKWKWAFWASR